MENEERATGPLGRGGPWAVAGCGPAFSKTHLKVLGCSLVLSALLTKKLPTFLLRLNEISGGCEKILPVSGSFWSKLLRMMLLTA